MWFILLTLAIVALTVLIRRQYSYWARQGVPYDEPHIPFGSLRDTVFGKKSAGFVIYEVYKRLKGRVVGIYLLFKPALLIRDAELARQVLTQDFGNFHDRGTDTNASEDLFSLRGERWKSLRVKLTPSFTTGKLKGMLPTVNNVADKLLDHLNSELEGKGTQLIEVKDLMTTYATDIIGTVFFGLDIDSFKNPENEFRQISNELIFPAKWLDAVHVLSQFICPSLAKLMEYFGYVPSVFLKIRNLIARTVEFREKHNIVRRDFLQLLLQLRNAGKINEDDKNWNVETTADNLKCMSIEMISDQCMLFQAAGTETTSATAAFTLYELSMYPEHLKKVVAEVQSVLSCHGLKPTDPLTYEAMQDMKFLELCIMETTRKYPGLPFLNRECTKDFPIPNSDYVVKKGTAIIISLFGLQRDPEYFADPLRYDPYRFSEEQRNYNPAAYMPFGEGPRHCIAKRMGVINSKIAVIKVLANFKIEPRECKEVEFEYNSSPLLVPKGGIKVKLTKLSSTTD